LAISDIETRQDREQHALIEVAKALTVHLELPKLLEVVMDKIYEVLDPAEFGVVLLWDPSEGRFLPKATCGDGITSPNSLHQIRLRENESITGIIYSKGEALLWKTPEEVSEAQRDMRPRNRELMLEAFGSLAPKSILATPLCVGDSKYGVLIFGTITGEARFTLEDIPFVQTIADLIALAINRSKLESDSAAIEVAEQANRLQAEAMAILSHELRTPLAAIKGYSTALLLEEVDWSEEKIWEFLKLIDQECDHLQTMIGDILDSSLIDVDQMTLEIQPVRLQHLAREVVDEMKHRVKIHRLVVDIPDNFPIVDADSFRIKQVIRNIIDNSIKYSPEGGLIVIRGEERPKDVVVSVSDQGVGISQEDLIPLFERYFRVKASTGYHVPGTGLGLPVARTIIENHNGRIWAESKVGEGTTLYFSLPKMRSNVDG
jgi:signal transduction histidine kinase